MRRSLAYFPAVGALLLTSVAFAAPADDGTFRGHTAQGFKTRVTYKDGQVQFVLVPWRAKRCTPRDGYRITFRRWNYQNTAKGPIEQSADGRRFHDSGRVVDKTRRSRAVVVAHLTGHFASDNRIVGTQRIRVRSHDRFGDHRCVAKMRWSARRAG